MQVGGWIDREQYHLEELLTWDITIKGYFDRLHQGYQLALSMIYGGAPEDYAAELS